jgi:checkpoint serine/threonine-protein kinase
MATLAPPATPGGGNLTTSRDIPATPTTDFTLIEAQKENIVPLSTGRSAAILSNVLTKERSEADRMVHEGHERHKRMIEETNRREAEGDELPNGINDVLEPYCR